MRKNAWLANPPDLVHIATEGPLGWAALNVALKLDIPVTTDFHTNFDAYSEHYGLGWLRGTIKARGSECQGEPLIICA